MSINSGYENMKQYDDKYSSNLPENKQKSKIYEDIYDIDLEIAKEEHFVGNDVHILMPPMTAGCTRVGCKPTSEASCKFC